MNENNFQLRGTFFFVVILSLTINISSRIYDFYILKYLNRFNRLN